MADNQFLAELLRSNGQARNRAGQPVDAYSTDMFTGAMQGLGNILGGAARGSLTSTLGLGGDINQAIVDNLGTAINASGLPTTKDVQEMLPYQPTTHEGQIAQKLGEFAPISPKVLGKMVRATKDMPIGNMIAYHGTPHEIKGSFDISKVGTGEGAQAYGHGMYFAENPKVAESYAGISPTSGSYPPMRRSINGVEVEVGTPEAHAATLLNANGMTVKKAKDLVNSWINDPSAMSAGENTIARWKKTLDTLNTINKKSDVKDVGLGNLYKVDIPDAYIPTMMDYDKPLGQQSAIVKKALNNMRKQITPEMKMELGGDMNLLFGKDITPVQFLNTMEIIHPTGGVGIGEKMLNELGVKGMRYLDATSRNTGKGTSNFVVFDPKEVKILEKNSKKLGE